MPSVSINTIAAEACVSRNTVSLALRGDPRVAPATRDRVLAAAKKLNYRPNRLAQAMVTGRSAMLGLAVPRLDFSYLPRLVDAIQEAAFQHDYGILTCYHHNEIDRLPGVLRYLDERQVDGVIVHCPPPPKEKFPAALSRCRTVYLGFGNQLLPGFTLNLLPQAAGELAVTKLYELGHRRLGYAGETTGFFGSLRWKGVLAAARRLGLVQPARFPGENSIAGGRSAAERFLNATTRPTAVLAFTDTVAAGFLQQVTAAGLVSPRDVSVVGTDDLPLAEAVQPRLTTLRAPAEEMGRESVMALISSSELPQQPRSIDWQWVPRESTGAI